MAGSILEGHPRSYSRLRPLPSLAFGLCCFVFGCALPLGGGDEVLVGHLSTARDESVQRRVVLGLDVRRSPAETGATIGVSDVRRMVPVGDRSVVASACTAGLESPGALRLPVGDSCHRYGVIVHAVPSGENGYFESATGIGVSVRESPLGRGLSIGFSTGTITIPGDSPDIHVLEYHARDPLRSVWTTIPIPATPKGERP